MAPTDPETAAPETEGDDPGTDDGIGSRMADQIEETEASEDQGESQTYPGTDSEVLVPPPLDEELESKLALFGQTYLAYDYRVSAESRLAPVQALVTADLYQSLVAPLPQALTESLADERRVVTAELVSVEGISFDPREGKVYQLSLLVSETTTPSPTAEPITEERTEHLTIFLGLDGVIEDVR
jgi:hypothetical protein